MLQKEQLRQQRKKRVRAKVSGTAVHPRLSVFRSLKYISVQLIDDNKGITIVAADDRELRGPKLDRAAKVGKKIAELAQAKKISAVIFDRNGYRYHGRIKALADAARQAGLKF